MTRAALIALVLAGCGGDSYLVVTVDARGAVHDAASLAVTLGNSGTMLTHKLAIGAHAFPVQFSVDAPGRTGELDITAEADDANGIPVGLGSATTTVGAATAELMLDTTDFVVNTDFAMDQFLSEDFDYDAHGFQLGATSDGQWTVGFRDNCNNTSACNMYGRRFDNRGVATHTAAAAGTNSFLLTTTLTKGLSEPAIAAAGTSTLAVWSYTDTVGMPAATGIACRSLDQSGNESSGQLSLASDAASVVSVAPLSNGNFAVTWEIGTPAAAIRTIIARPDCTTLSPNVQPVSATAGTSYGPESAHVATNADKLMYAWIVDGDVYVHAGTNIGPSGAGDAKVLTHNTTQQARGVRLAPLGTGFALVVRWVNPSGSGAGKIELFQLTTAGALMTGAQPTLITDQSRSDFVSGWQSPGIAARATDGAVLVVWHQCDDQGSPGSCDVYGRMVRPDATTSGDPFMIPTTTTGDQTSPSTIALPDGSFAVAWNDQSHSGVDDSGYAVRARIIYPVYSATGN